jgi:hypothetical protein
MLPADRAVDGELVGLDSTGGCRSTNCRPRLVTTAANARRLVRASPASYLAFDLAAVNAVDIGTQQWNTRRGRLESAA